MHARTGALVAVLLAFFSLAPPALAQQAPPVTAEGAVVWEPADDRVLWGKEAGVPMPMASTTKIMTVLLALEAGALDQTLTVSEHAAEVGQIPGAATLGLQAGQRLPVREVLAALMLRSGNDAAVAVAEHVAGSVDAFVDRMNAKAAALGLADTHFVNASGLTDDGDHHASAVDLARLAEEAMARPAFARWAGTEQLTLGAFGTLENRNELLETYRGATGVKTGFTRLAGLCLVASARRDGRTVFAVVLGSDASDFDQHFEDAAALLTYGFEDFRRVEPLPAGASAMTYRWAGHEVELVSAETLGRTLPDDVGRVTVRTRLEPDLARPAAAGALAGETDLLVNGKVVDRVALETAAAVPAPQAAASAAGRVGAGLESALRVFARLRPVEQTVATGS